MKQMLINLLRRNAGKKKMQKIYAFLYRESLQGMNYGGGGDFQESGEFMVLQIIRGKYPVGESLVFFDVGGNVGNYSKSLADFFGKNVTIHSFEPSKNSFEQFIKTTAHLSNIIPNNFGFSDTEKSLELFTNSETSELASVYQRNLTHFGITMDKSELIQLSTIDTYCARHNIERIHFLKLDIEGHELSALKGAVQMINNKKIDFIQFEFGGCNIDSRTYFQDFFYFFKDKYRIYRILKDGLLEIAQYKETGEIFVTTNYFAEMIR